MMECAKSTPRYDRVQLVACFKDEEAAPLLSAIAKKGVKNIKVCKDLETMMGLLEDSLVDVLLCDYSLLGPDFLDMVKKTRRKSRGRNPFIVVIATVDKPTVSLVRSLIDVGVDDLLRAPLATERLAEGIEKFTRARKPFVASHDYVGPTRRSAKRDNGDSSGLMHVPNTLRSKVVHNVSDAELQRMVDVALIELDDKQLETRGIEIDDAATRLREVYQMPVRHSELPALLDRLSELAVDFHQRCEGHASLPITNLAEMLLALVRRLKLKQPDDANTEVQLMSNLAQAIRRALTVERDAVGLMQEIVDTIGDHPLP